jgi:hypothetical protein
MRPDSNSTQLSCRLVELDAARRGCVTRRRTHAPPRAPRCEIQRSLSQIQRAKKRSRALHRGDARVPRRVHVTTGPLNDPGSVCRHQRRNVWCTSSRGFGRMGRYQTGATRARRVVYSFTRSRGCAVTTCGWHKTFVGRRSVWFLCRTASRCFEEHFIAFGRVQSGHGVVYVLGFCHPSAEHGRPLV